MKKLLVLTSGFPQIKTNRYNCQFVFDITHQAEKYFDQITVISPQPVLPHFLSQLPVAKKYAGYANYQDYQVGKIRVYYPRFWTIPLPLFRDLRHWWFYFVAKRLISKQKIQFDIIQAHFLYPAGTAASMLSKQYHVPVILNLHGGDIYEWPQQSSQHLSVAKKTLQLAKKIVVPSQYLAAEAIKVSQHCQKKLTVISHTVDLKMFCLRNRQLSRQKLGLPRRAKILLNVANLVEGKGHVDLLLAYRKLSKKHVHLHLYIVGDGPQKQFLERYRTKYHLDNLHLVGGVTHEDLPCWYSAANLFVFPSYHESFGLVQIEAMACGLPIVAYDNPGSKEILANHQNVGFLVKRSQTQLLAKSITKALKNKWSRQIIRHYAMTHYSQIVTSQQWRTLYKYF